MTLLDVRNTNPGYVCTCTFEMFLANYTWALCYDGVSGRKDAIISVSCILDRNQFYSINFIANFCFSPYQ